MDRFQLRHLPVVDGSKLVGLVTHRDVLRYTVSALEAFGVAQQRNERLQADTFVAQVMTRDVRAVRPNDPIRRAAEIMLKGRFGCVPVTDEEGNLVGIVTEHDMLGLLLDLLG